MTSKNHFDVCVIGTGAGGGVMIDRLTAAGFKVVALQRGPELDGSDFKKDAGDELKNVVRRQVFAPDLLETFRPDADSPTESGRFNPLAHCVGGTMTIWAGWAWRFMPDEFRVLSKEGPVSGASLADWPVTYEELEPYYERAEWDFGVSGDAGSNKFEGVRHRGYPNPPHPPRAGSRIFTTAAAKLGLHTFPIPMAINSQTYDGRPACVYRGACQQYGCPIDAKATSLSVSLPRALETGNLELRSSSLAVEILVGKDGQAKGVRYIDQSSPTLEAREVFAKQIVVAGNSIGTSHLLLLSKSTRFPDGLANSSGQVGRNLTFHTVPAVHFTLDQPTFTFTGNEVHRGLDNFHPSDPARGFIRGGVIADHNFLVKQPLVYALAAQSGHPTAGKWGPSFKEYLRDFPRTMTIAAVLEDLPMEKNGVDVDPLVKDKWNVPVARITHGQHPNDVAMFNWFEARMLEIAAAAKPTEVWAGKTPGLDIRQGPMKGSGHIMGTCRMGNNPSRSVVDKWCRSHDVPNLWIVDGSVFPTSGGYNPTLTILANAYRVADRFVSEVRRGNVK